jgi:hypothetical protein
MHPYAFSIFDLFRVGGLDMIENGGRELFLWLCKESSAVRWKALSGQRQDASCC